MKALSVSLLALMMSLSWGQPSPSQDALTVRLKEQADYWFEKGDFPRAIAALSVLFNLNPHGYEEATDLGWMLENVQRLDEALAVYVRYTRENPDDPDRGLPEADFYFRQKLYSRVPALLESGVATKRAHPNSYRVLAHAYDRMGRFRDSLRIWDLLVADHPEDAAAKVNRDRVAKKIAG